MDAAELDALLQDVRDYMVMVRGGDKPFIDALTDIARENKPAAKGIGHIIEQHLLKADAAYKLGAFLLIDSIVQNVGEPYVTYFSLNFVKMFCEVWEHSGPNTRERMKRWLAHYRSKQVFPLAILDQVQARIDPRGSATSPSSDRAAVPSGGRHDPRRPVGTATSANPSQGSVNLHSVSSSAPSSHPAYAHPVPSHAWAPSWGAAGPAGTPAVPGHQYPLHVGTISSFPLGAYAPGGLPPPPAGSGPVPLGTSARPQLPGPPPLGSTFSGVRLQDFRPEALTFLNEVTRKIRTHLNDKRILRERSKREGGVRMRQWYAQESIWIRGVVAPSAEAPKRKSNKEQPTQSPPRFVVVKDETQPLCAICGEAFLEEWDEELQEWVFVDAVRLPAAIAQQPDIGLPAGAIVKIGLLDPEAQQLLANTLEKGKQGTALAKRGRGGSAARNLGGQLSSDDDNSSKKVKMWADSDDESKHVIQLAV